MNRNLNELSNNELIVKLKTLVEEERRCVVSQIVYLKEVFERKLYIQFGYGSLSAFCQEELFMTENQAWKRSQVVRLSVFHPDFLEMIARGETKLSYVALAASKITQQNKEKIKEALKGKTRKDVEGFLSRISSSGEILENVEERIEIKISFSKEVAEKLERARKICSIGKRDVDFSSVINEALDLLLDKKDPVKKAEKAMEKEKAPSSEKAKEPKEKVRSRYISKPLRDQVILRAKGRCEFISPDGKRCTETTRLEIDHIKPFCRNGSHSKENLRVLCSSHNKFMAQKILGPKFNFNSPSPGLVDS